MKTKLLLLFFIATLITNSQTPKWQWANIGYGPTDGYAQSISVDKNGNTYATGFFQTPQIIFSNDTLNGTTNYNYNFYIVKHDSSGKEIWARSAGGNNNCQGQCIHTDENGNSYVSGWFQGSGIIKFGDSIITSPNHSAEEAFIVKYDAAGNVLWAKDAGKSGASPTLVKSGIDISGNVYVSCEGTLLQKFDKDGNLKWKKSASGNYRTVDVATDIHGNSFVTGTYFNTTMNFGTKSIANSSTGWLVFVVKYDSSGNDVWAKQEGGSYPSFYFPNIATDGNGNCFVSGYFNGHYAMFDSITLANSSGNNNAFFFKMNDTGHVVWAKNSLDGTSSSSVQIHNIIADEKSNTYLTGLLGAVGNDGVYVSKFNSSGNPVWVKTAKGSLAPYGICRDDKGYIYILGEYRTYSQLDSIPLINSDTVINSSEVFVARLGGSIISGITETITQKSINIFPNPTKNNFTIQYFSLEKTELAIYNILGEKIYSDIWQPSQPQRCIDVSQYAKGMYVVRIGESWEKVMINANND